MMENAITMELGGTTYIIHECFDGTATINDIIAKRVMNDEGNHSGNLLPPVPG